MSMQAMIQRQLFNAEELYAILNDPLALKILLYLRNGNPKVPLQEIADLIGRNRGETLKLLAGLYYKGFIEIREQEKYDLNARVRNALDALLA